MNTSDMYDKTASGKTEIAENGAGLSMMERRVLILINGENDVAKLTKLSLCKEIGPTIDRLLELGLVEAVESTVVDLAAPAAEAVAAADGNDPVADVREFMCNTLQTFGNRVRIADLNNAIADTDDFAGLEGLVKAWYQAISETPGGMYQADDLRKDLLAQLEAGKKHAA